MTELMNFTVNSRIRELWTCQNVWPLHMGASYICSSEEECLDHSCDAGRPNFSEANLPLHSQSLGTQAAHSVSYRPSSGPMLNVGSCNDDCSLRTWNVRRTMAPEEWDPQRKIECACRTGWEQDRNKTAHGAMGWTWELVLLNQILNNVLNTYMRDSFGAIVALCRFDLRRV
jgi:hypothetical protein